MKKLLSFILIIAMALSLGNTIASANTIDSNINSQLFIETTTCPQEYINFTENNISGFIESSCEGCVSYSSIIVGTPFTFLDYGSDVYYFPVICDSVIKFIFRVYPDQSNGYDAAISSFLAEELESLAKNTSVTTPLKLNNISNKIIATIGNNEYILFTYPESINDISLQSESDNIRELGATKIINAKSDVGITVTIDESTPLRDSWSYYIDLDITETQGQIYFSMAKSNSNHAVVLRGYNSRRSTWSIWNTRCRKLKAIGISI